MPKEILNCATYTPWTKQTQCPPTPQVSFILKLCCFLERGGISPSKYLGEQQPPTSTSCFHLGSNACLFAKALGESITEDPER